MTSFELPGIYIEAVGGRCPCQAFGVVRGLQFYFRARAGGWTLVVGWPDENVDGCTGPGEAEVIWQAEGEDPKCGHMPRQVAFALVVHHLGWNLGGLPTRCQPG